MAKQKAAGLVFRPNGVRCGIKVPKGVIMARYCLALSVNGMFKNALQMSTPQNILNFEDSLKKSLELVKGNCLVLMTSLMRL
jgi:hypothetical protein